MKNNWFRFIIIFIIIILLIYHLHNQIKKDCSKDPKNCSNHKRKIIATSIILLGIGIIAPGFSWIPAGIATKKYGKTYGIKILELTIILGIIITVIGVILYFI
jgi:hypothetical protein